MKKKLKNIRRIIALFFLLTILLVFIDFPNVIKPAVINKILYFQFTPSLMKFISDYSFAASGFIFIIILTIAVGRLYCSLLCPLGVFMDLMIFFGKRFRTEKLKFNSNYNYIRYSILLVFIISLLLSSSFIPALLDPYSNFGRIATFLFRPVIIFINNSLASVLEKTGIYILYTAEIVITISVASFVILYTIFLSVLSFYKGRLYCNSLCPVGALLSLISRFSFYGIKINQYECKNCGNCEKICKTGSIDLKNKKINYSTCVVCFDCISECSFNSIDMGNRIYVNELDYSKRKSICTGTAMISFAAINLYSMPLSVNNKKIPITPPGSKGLDNFTNNCVACMLCVSRCPMGVLRPSIIDYGMKGIFLPKMDYSKSFCNYDCIDCSQVCPTGAIQKISLKQKQLTQIGRVSFVKEKCIVFLDNTDCGACSEHCPTKAVYMKDYKGSLYIPEVENSFCVGCGACEYVCPVNPKAITVESSIVHNKAAKRNRELPSDIKTKYEFPF